MRPLEMVHLETERARTFCRQVLEQAGTPPDEALVCAESMVDASLRGVDSHGVALLPTYVERIRSGQIRPGRRWIVRREGVSTALCEGRCGLGPVLACAAMDLAADKAREVGLGAVVLVDGNYVGALGFYALRAARRGMLGICAANSTPRVAPHGGRDALHGTNPLAYAAPGPEAEPLLFDAATGHAAARVQQVLEEGGRLCEGMALDREGRETTDPAAALAGILLPVGGALGYGLGLLVDLLAGGLAGGPCGPEVPPARALAGPYGCGFFALVIDPEHFGGREVFAARCGFLAESARAGRPAPGFERVRVPGDRGAAQRRRRRRRGIPFARRRWRALLDRLRACDVDLGAWETL